MELSWQPNPSSDEVTAYIIEYTSEDSTAYVKITDVTSSEYTLLGLSADTQYKFCIRAENEYGSSGTSPYVQVTTLAAELPPCGPPRNFSATLLSFTPATTSIKLSWAEPPEISHGKIIKYEIYVITRNHDFETFLSDVVNTSIVFDWLHPDTEYMFQVRAYTSVGSGPWTNKLPFRTPSPAPTPPTNIQLYRISSTAIEVHWDPPSMTTAIAGFRIYYTVYDTAASLSPTEMDTWQSIEVGLSQHAEISGLIPHAMYAVRVRSKSSDYRYGDFSDIVTKVTIDDPEMVQDLHTIAQGSHTVQLEWQPPKREPITYQIEHYTDDDNTNEVNYVSHTTNELQINGLMPNTIYYFTVSAKFSSPDQCSCSWGPNYTHRVQTNVGE